MASKTLTIQNSETWIYPPITYTGVDWVYRPKNTWTKNHSDPDRRAKRYQAGNDVSDGQYNGNMMSHFFFSSGSTKMKDFISSIGGSKKITKITLTMTCGHAYYSAMDVNVCMGYSWDTSSKYHGKTADTYSGLGIDKMTTVTIAAGATKTIDLTAHKAKFDNGETICIYAPGAYDKDFYAYGWIYGHSSATAAQKPKLTIEYTTNTAPNKPGVTIHSSSDSSGYYVPNLDFSIVNNGDPDNNLHSLPFAYEFYDNSGTRIYSSTWYSSLRHKYDLSKYRGQAVKVRTIARDTYSLTAYNDKTIYINSLPYWKNLGANSQSISFSSGVTNGVFQDSVTLTWPKATDDQTKQSLRYYVYAQKGTDSGPSGDKEANKVSGALTTNSFTVDATKLKGLTVNKGDRIYFSVWAYDGLESSSYRLISPWIYRETPPSAPSNVTPVDGHYESSVDVSWSNSSAENGTTIKHYEIDLLNSSNTVVKSYTSKTTSFTCKDLSSITRGSKFRFKVVAINNLNTQSTAGYSGWAKRNSAPTNPKNFKVDSTSMYVKNSVPLVWTASTDADEDTIKYNIYYNINNGQFQELVKGITKTSYSHDISSFIPGTTINYYIEAYDTFNVFSDKVYVLIKPQVNTPPKAPTFTIPIKNRTMYTTVPRIVFNTSEVYNGNDLTAVVNVNGKEYRSDSSNCFDKTSYAAKTQGMFIVPDNAPLNYTNNNTINIKVYDGLDYSSETTLTLSCASSPLSNKSAGDKITADDLNTLKAMINANRFAYNLAETSWHDGNLNKDITFVYKKYFEQAITSIHDLNNNINNKTTNSLCKRIYTKDSIATGTVISKNVFNNILSIIKKS